MWKISVKKILLVVLNKCLGSFLEESIFKAQFAAQSTEGTWAGIHCCWGEGRCVRGESLKLDGTI